MRTILTLTQEEDVLGTFIQSSCRNAPRQCLAVFDELQASDLEAWEDAKCRHAMQVKSTDGQFAKAEVGHWASKLEASGAADGCFANSANRAQRSPRPRPVYSICKPPPPHPAVGGDDKEDSEEELNSFVEQGHVKRRVRHV